VTISPGNKHDVDAVFMPGVDQPPAQCPACGAMILRRHGCFGEFRSCRNFPRCDIVVSKSSSDGRWRVTTSTLRKARIQVHNLFDPLWRFGGSRRTPRTKRRNDLYRALAARMCLSPHQCHVSHLGTVGCVLALKAIREIVDAEQRTKRRRSPSRERRASCQTAPPDSTTSTTS